MNSLGNDPIRNLPLVTEPREEARGHDSKPDSNHNSNRPVGSNGEPAQRQTK